MVLNKFWSRDDPASPGGGQQQQEQKDPMMGKTPYKSGGAQNNGGGEVLDPGNFDEMPKLTLKKTNLQITLIIDPYTFLAPIDWYGGSRNQPSLKGLDDALQTKLERDRKVGDVDIQARYLGLVQLRCCGTMELGGDYQSKLNGILTEIKQGELRGDIIIIGDGNTAGAGEGSPSQVLMDNLAQAAIEHGVRMHMLYIEPNPDTIQYEMQRLKKINFVEDDDAAFKALMDSPHSESGEVLRHLYLHGYQTTAKDLENMCHETGGKFVRIGHNSSRQDIEKELGYIGDEILHKNRDEDEPHSQVKSDKPAKRKNVQKERYPAPENPHTEYIPELGLYGGQGGVSGGQGQKKTKEPPKTEDKVEQGNKKNNPDQRQQPKNQQQPGNRSTIYGLHQKQEHGPPQNRPKEDAPAATTARQSVTGPEFINSYFDNFRALRIDYSFIDDNGKTVTLDAATKNENSVLLKTAQVRIKEIITAAKRNIIDAASTAQKALAPRNVLHIIDKTIFGQLGYSHSEVDKEFIGALNSKSLDCKALCMIYKAIGEEENYPINMHAIYMQRGGHSIISWDDGDKRILWETHYEAQNKEYGSEAELMQTMRLNGSIPVSGLMPLNESHVLGANYKIFAQKTVDDIEKRDGPSAALNNAHQELMDRATKIDPDNIDAYTELGYYEARDALQKTKSGGISLGSIDNFNKAVGAAQRLGGNKYMEQIAGKINQYYGTRLKQEGLID